MFHTAAPFLAWRALVLSCPKFYPDLKVDAREALLDLAEKALESSCFIPGLAEGMFA